MRVAFVIVPDFVFEAHRRDGGPLARLDAARRARVALVEGEGGRASLRAVAPELLAEGVRAGMTVARARARVGHIWVLGYEAERVARENGRLAGVLLGSSPQVRVMGDGVFWVGADGCRFLGGEPGLLERIESQVRQAGHPTPKVGLADSVIAARAAALHGLGIISAGAEGDAMAPLPLSVLPLERGTREALWALGIHSVGAFSALPASPIAARFGPDAVAAHRLARGDDRRTVPVLSEPEAPGIDVDFETLHSVAEPAIFVLRGGLERLIAPHRARGFGVSALKIELALQDGHWERTVRPADPAVDPDRLLDMCRALLQDAELPAMMKGLRAEVVEVAPAKARQEGLWQGRRQRTATLDYTLARLQGRLGPEAVVTPGIREDTHLPERRASWTDVPLRPPRLDLAPDRAHLSAVWRLKRPPRRIELQERKGLPERADIGGRWESFRCVAGPQRIETAWFESEPLSLDSAVIPKSSWPDPAEACAQPIRRDYWYAELRGGSAVSIYHDLVSNQWFLQGVMD